MDDAKQELPEAFSPPPGWYAIDVNLLRGYPYATPNGNGGRQWQDKPYFAYFRNLEPVARIGYWIYIYHVTTNGQD